ncbi:EF-hand domain-containing protein [Pseudoteredinibacter isoporae]|uniref:Ca2+-binding EF-hand superfamily protein n=1 Tax=Pseudoteredinibacter isoporae TaxID=570281 RepID=A0A7X0MWE3_9GAMM|nr:EF-hand domain-containing protein [Pseudoteredinibacter isoporae]MBB6522631.1 Ca2+-binding EF-hand superfamily protein [Pseudoteredinibacter isoporae]NHO88161.1 hypothetical protein [Pseudoteredinibacter isoporae]NIB23508.1 hypothetical protein [Pseudoteredinibacter isoporae]
MKKIVTMMIALAATSQAYAFPGADERKEKLDLDGDGIITRTEIQAAKSARFADMDTDKNGQLSQAELSAYGEAKKAEMQAKMFARLDGDSNGTVSLEEFIDRRPGEREQVARNVFVLADVNQDGQLTQEELVNAKSDRAAMRFARMDLDGNGEISEEEFSESRKHSKKKMRKMFRR